jgi:hypothetical protein
MDTRVHPTERPVQLAAVGTRTHAVLDYQSIEGAPITAQAGTANVLSQDIGGPRASHAEPATSCSCMTRGHHGQEGLALPGEHEHGLEVVGGAVGATTTTAFTGVPGPATLTRARS